jgi:hypothetical protein
VPRNRHRGARELGVNKWQRQEMGDRDTDEQGFFLAERAKVPNGDIKKRRLVDGVRVALEAAAIETARSGRAGRPRTEPAPRNSWTALRVLTEI